MEQVSFLLTLLAAKGLGALIGGLFLLTRTVPGFADPSLVVRADSVRLVTRLSHAFNRQLDQLLESGTTVAVGYSVTVLERDGNGPARAVTSLDFVHSAVYDPATATYAVYRSELAGTADSLVPAGTLPGAKELLAGVSVALLPVGRAPPGRQFAARIQAALNTITIEAMNDQELDLNSLWNYRYPTAVTPWTGPEGR